MNYLLYKCTFGYSTVQQLSKFANDWLNDCSSICETCNKSLIKDMYINIICG